MIDADISTHASYASAHHARYIDSEAVAAIKAADGAGSTLDADLLDGNDSSAFANTLHTHTGSLYNKVAIVAQSGGDYISPLDAMNDIAAWCGTASSTNPCLVRIMPGIYDLGNNGLMMQSYVDIEGSGENTTTISSMHSSDTFGTPSATVVGADKTEIRFLTVENLGGSAYAQAIYNNSASPKITNVTATASGGTFSNYGMTNSSSSPTIKNSSISGLNSIYNFGVGTTKVGATMLGGPILGSAFTCVGVYDVNFVALDSSCL